MQKNKRFKLIHTIPPHLSDPISAHSCSDTKAVPLGQTHPSRHMKSVTSGHLCGVPRKYTQRFGQREAQLSITNGLKQLNASPGVNHKFKMNFSLTTSLSTKWFYLSRQWQRVQQARTLQRISSSFDLLFLFCLHKWATEALLMDCALHSVAFIFLFVDFEYCRIVCVFLCFAS